MAAATELAALRRLSPRQLAHRLRAEKARRSLSAFIRQAWEVHHEYEPLLWGWHIDAIAEHLEAVSRGEIRKLVINVPPGFMKSLIVSVYWPAWEWIDKPYLQYLCVSAVKDVALRDALRCRQLVESSWYRRSFLPQWGFDPEQNAKGYFLTTEGGARKSQSVGSRIIGFRAHRQCIDDPLDAEGAYSDKAELLEASRWIWDVFLDRKHHHDDPTVMIMQRLHERDPAGVAIERGWDALILPNEYEGPRSNTFLVREGRWRDPRNDNGELLHPKRQNERVTEELKVDKRNYARKQQQRPAPASGQIYVKGKFRYWLERELLPEFQMVFSSWDLAGYRKTKDSDHIVGQVWGVRRRPPAANDNGPDRRRRVQLEKYLLHQVRGKMGTPAAIAAIRGVHEMFPEARAAVIERKATGADVADVVRDQLPHVSVVEWDPQDTSKEQRAWAVQPQFEDELIFFPDPEAHPWVELDLEAELLVFPEGATDDQVDALNQAILWATFRKSTALECLGLAA